MHQMPEMTENQFCTFLTFP